jgi:sugar phosphate isomerase/epimerase
VDDRLRHRLGLTVPNEWWASASLLKSFEAAGFVHVQVHSPPSSVLVDARQCTEHARSLAAALATTSLDPVVHAPAELTAGSPAGDAAFEGLLSYAAEAGAAQVVYHARAMPDVPAREAPLMFEARSLGRLAARAERLGVTIAMENLAPVYPGPETLSASPLALRGLANRIGSERVGICLDLGHAHIVAEGRKTAVENLIEPVLDLVTVFHLHDNLGARWPGGPPGPTLDPLRLDLHLPPGEGTLRWKGVASMLRGHAAPLILEVHPPHLGRPAALFGTMDRLLNAVVADRPTPISMAR